MSDDPSKQATLEFFCHDCGHDIHCSPDLAGSKTRCPTCASPNTVPTPETLAPTSEAAPAEKVIKFFCIFCGQKLSTPEAMAGVKFDCPSCTKAISVPGEKQAPATTAVPLLKFFCTCCGQKLSCEPAFAG